VGRRPWESHGALLQPINDECDRLWKEWTDTKEGRFQGLDVLAARYRQTGDAKYAQATRKLFNEYRQLAQSYDPKRKDPIRWSIAFQTQHVLAHLRETMYASQAIAYAKPRETKQEK
jgi:LPS sulfotransferase NodH